MQRGEVGKVQRFGGENSVTNKANEWVAQRDRDADFAVKDIFVTLIPAKWVPSARAYRVVLDAALRGVRRVTLVNKQFGGAGGEGSGFPSEPPALYYDLRFSESTASVSRTDGDTGKIPIFVSNDKNDQKTTVMGPRPSGFTLHSFDVIVSLPSYISSESFDPDSKQFLLWLKVEYKT